MINIRRGLFETNSSSTHSIGIQRDNQLNIPASIILDTDDYGWEHDILLSPEERGSYLYSAFVYIYEDKPKILSEWKNYIYNTCYEAGCEVEFKDLEYDEEYNWLDHCSVDHAYELEDLLKSLRHSKKKLLRFLFGSDSYIILSNDNDGYEYFEEMTQKFANKNVDIYYKGN